MRTGIIWLLKMVALVGILPLCVGGFKGLAYVLKEGASGPLYWFLGIVVSYVLIHLYGEYMGGLFFELRFNKSIRHVWILLCAVKWVLFFGLGLLSVPVLIYLFYLMGVELFAMNEVLSWAVGGFFGFVLSLAMQVALISLYRDRLTEIAVVNYPYRRD